MDSLQYSFLFAIYNYLMYVLVTYMWLGESIEYGLRQLLHDVGADVALLSGGGGGSQL